MTRSRVSGWTIATSCALATFILAAPSSAQTEAAAPSAHGGWKISATIGATGTYDDNPFLLSPTKKSELEAPSAGQVTSGKYVNMTSATDLVTLLSGSLEFKGRGISGQTVRVIPRADYELYGQNSERSNLGLRLDLEQDLGHGGRIRAQGSYAPSYFAKNYLADAVDGNADLVISSDERVYRPGQYREAELGGDLRFRLVKAAKHHPFGAAIQVGGGYYDRAYDSPFATRDLNGPLLDATLLLDLGRSVRLDLSYDFASLGATPGDMVELLDEPDFSQDFNNNGNTTDLNVRVVAPVDYSRKEHNLGAALRFALGRRSDLKLDFVHRWRHFSSTEPLDVSNRDREDWRNQLGGELDHGLGRHLDLRLGGSWTRQKLNRAGDPGAQGEVNDYTHAQALLGLTYGF